MRIVRRGEPLEPVKFTGSVEPQSMLDVQQPSDVRVLYVTFKSGTRTYWHSHREQQMLYVVEGNGCVQKWGEAPNTVKPGDTIYIAPGEKHWHGQGVGEGLPQFVHIAINIGETDWMEEVTNAEVCQDSVS